MSQPSSFFPFNWFDQNINPVTTWFSPSVSLNFAGDKPLEEQINAEVASYGKQLGILTEAVLALAADSSAPEVKRLRRLQEEVDVLKLRHQGKLLGRIEADLDRLRRQDPNAFRDLVKKLRVD